MPTNPGRPGPPSAPAGHARRLMALMLGAGILLAGFALLWLWLTGTPLTLHLVLALSIMVIVTMGLAGALMALLFHSSRNGHDEGAGG